MVRIQGYVAKVINVINLEQVDRCMLANAVVSLDSIYAQDVLLHGS